MNLEVKGITIRKTVESDLRQIYTMGLTELPLQETRMTFDAENLAELFTSERVIALTAIRGKKVLGFIIGSITGNKCRIEWFIIIEKLRKKGIGTKMLHLFTESVKKFGVEHFFIALFVNNSESVNFFNKRGFSVKNTFSDLYRNSNEKFYQGLSE